MKMTSENFENVLRFQHEFMASDCNCTCMSNQKPTLTRDFNTMFMNASEFNHESTHPGSFREIQTTGSGFQTQWYFYHSPTHHKLFLVWVSGNRLGFRLDIERIQVGLDNDCLIQE